MSLRKCSISGASEVETPVGNLPVESTIRDELLRTGLFDTTSRKIDEDEHSIEMHLPYIATLLSRSPGSSIIPIMVGNVSARSAEQYAATLQPYFDRDDTLFVISR